MPPTLTWKQMLITGVVLTVVGLLARMFLGAVLVAVLGNGALNNGE